MLNGETGAVVLFSVVVVVWLVALMMISVTV